MSNLPAMFQFGPFTLDPRERLLRRDGEPVPLTPKALDLLVALLERPGRLVSKEELLQEVWPNTFVEESNLSYNIFALRKALGDTRDNPEYIETIPKRGYRFKALITPASISDGPSHAHGDSTDASMGGSRAILEFPEPARRQFDGTAVLKTAPEHVSGASGSMTPSRSGPRTSVARRWVVTVTAAALVVAAYPTWRMWRVSVNDIPPQATPLTSARGVVQSPSLSPDGNYVAFTWSGPDHDNFDIYVQQIGAGSPLRLTSHPNNDHGPSWSPDGRTIAFLRRGPAGGKTEVWLIAPLGGTERKLADIQPQRTLLQAEALSWCPDSSCVLVTDSGADERDAVFAIAVDTGQKRQLTDPRGLVRDADGAISPDGRHLIFRRDATPLSGEFYRVSLATGFVPARDPVRLTQSLNAGRATWMPDSREIVFASRGALWRLDALSGGTPVRVAFVGQDGVMPALARTADKRQRLVYVRSLTDTNVWRIDLPAAGAGAAGQPTVAISSTRTDAIASISPDARQLAFLSNRSGDAQIWVARRDGADARPVSSLAFRSTPGFPRWSPDGRQIVFHGDPEGRPDAFLVPVTGGNPTLLMKNAAFPNFSRDAQWIYLSSADRQGELRIFKIPAVGGDRVQVTDDAGTLAIESYDGDLYYVDTVDRSGSIWRLRASAGAAARVLDGIVLGNFDVVDRGIYYIDQVTDEKGQSASDRRGGNTRLRFFDFATQQSTTVLTDLGAVTFGLSATRDGRMIFYSRIDSAVDELMVVDNFR